MVVNTISLATPPPNLSLKMKIKQAKFFKVLVGDFPSSLSIPPAFIHHVIGELPSNALLKTNGPKEWSVQMSKTDTGDVLFHGEGWSEFAEHHKLQLGEFLVFTYIGDLRFRVRIFSISGVERNYISEQVKCQEAKQKAVRVDGNYKTRNFETDTTLTKECSRLQNKVVVSANVSSSCISHPDTCNLRKIGVAESENCRPQVIEICDEDYGITSDGGNDKYHPKERGAKISSATRDSFTFVIGARRLNYLYIPVAFYQKNFSGKCMVNVKLYYGGEPNARTFKVSRKTASCCGVIYGLRSFYNQNNLKVGDTCRFELISGSSFKICKLHGKSKRKTAGT